MPEILVKASSRTVIPLSKVFSNCSSSANNNSDNSKKPLIVVIAGVTGSGKSAVAAELCAARNGIIVSADSVQAYRGVQIGANKPDAAERERTPHLLLDVADPKTSAHHYNAADWRRDALFVIRELLVIIPHI